MRKLVESTFVSLGGVIGDPQVWAPPYLDADHAAYANKLLFAADALLLGRRTYHGLSAAYPQMNREKAPLATATFIDRMNALPKYVVSKTLRTATWNATIIASDAATAIADLKNQPGESILKYGTGPLDRVLLEHGLVDEYHFWLFPVAVPAGQRLFEDLLTSAQLRLLDTTTFASGVVVSVYTPR
jgi:dihydrofolate reductase